MDEEYKNWEATALSMMKRGSSSEQYAESDMSNRLIVGGFNIQSNDINTVSTYINGIMIGSAIEVKLYGSNSIVNIACRSANDAYELWSVLDNRPYGDCILHAYLLDDSPERISYSKKVHKNINNKYKPFWFAGLCIALLSKLILIPTIIN